MTSTLPNPRGGTFTPAPEGSHPAACYRVIDLGTQEVNYKGVVSKKRQLLITWELFSEEPMPDGRPFTIGRKYTWSTHEKSGLRKDLEMWRGKKFSESDFGPGGFDIRRVIGQPCLITVTHSERDGNMLSNVAAVTKLPKAMTVGGPTNKTCFVWLDKDDFDQVAFDTLSDRLKDTIKASPEYRALTNGGTPVTEQFDAGHDPDDEIPF